MLTHIMATPLTSLKAALWIVLVISTTVYSRDWFGSASQYQCHCTNNNNCGVSGDCTDGCAKGWFGPQCQYADLVYTENDGTAISRFVDADDTTCNTDTNHKQSVVTFERTFPFTWLRLFVRSEGLALDSIDVTFTDGISNNNIQCSNRRSALIDSRTIDIYCDVSVEVKKVSVSGDAVGYLCSFYVSGGRNVALKQSATQSTTQGGGPEKAVDGNTNQNSNQGGSCSNTATTTSVIPVWIVTFSQINAVNRFVIYNRGDCCAERLLGFTLTSRNDNQEEVFSYQDSGPPALLIYIITTATQTSPVKSVNITTSHVDYATAIVPILALCEVEIYGDSICTVGKYGRECEYECHCASNEKCFVSTGRCPNGCAVGYTGDTCDETCPAGFYGAGCIIPCSQNCDGGLCQTDNGHCNECKAGWEGTFCNSECDATHYGKGCKNQCSINCKNQKCDRVDGECGSCIAGKMGYFCGTPCPTGFYGEGCTQQCNQNCDQGCQADDGHCIECKAGWEGTFCEKQCDVTHYGKGCKMSCSTNCKNQQCNREDGKCGSCIAGKKGDYCNTDCPKTMFGPGCTQHCSSNCVTSECNGITGRCDNCPDGKEGDQCHKDCDAKFYGQRCIHSCAKSCVDELCNRINGTCNACPSGKTGDQCREDCPLTTYGPRCMHQCSTNCVDSKCDGSTGFCIQCPDGKFGDYCDRACPEGMYGLGCKFNCSDTCKDPKDCDSNNGTCYGGCKDGYRGDLCVDAADCPHGKYGATCDQLCNKNCRNTDCDSDTGQCKAGCVPGYYGNMCQKQCEPGKYGKDCSSDCSEFCNTNGTRENESPCHPVSGTCSYGCVLGYEGPTCVARAQSSSPDSEPGVGVGVGIGVGVTVIVVVAVVGIYFYRRRKSAKKSRREIPPGYDPAEPTTEEHNYSELFKSDDGYNLPTDVASSAVTFKTPSKNSTLDTVQYVNADVNEDVNADAVKDDLKNDVTPYEDIDQITSEIDEGRKSNPREDNTGYANTGYANTGYANC